MRRASLEVCSKASREDNVSSTDEPVELVADPDVSVSAVELHFMDLEVSFRACWQIGRLDDTWVHLGRHEVRPRVS